MPDFDVRICVEGEQIRRCLVQAKSAVMVWYALTKIFDLELEDHGFKIKIKKFVPEYDREWHGNVDDVITVKHDQIEIQDPKQKGPK